MLSAEKAAEWFSYNPENGILTRIKRGTRGPDGRGPSGSLSPNGYLLVSVQGVNYPVHKIAWLLTHGTWPKLLDHWNRIKTDNRLLNLRPATHQQNIWNSKMRCSNKSGHTGVRKKPNGKFEAACKTNGVYVYLGTFFDAETAATVYKEHAARLRGEFSNP